jgi:hypothetical protein
VSEKIINESVGLVINLELRLRPRIDVLALGFTGATRYLNGAAHGPLVLLSG